MEKQGGMGAASFSSAKGNLSGGGRAPDLSLVPTFIVVAVDATGMGIILPLLPFFARDGSGLAFS